MNWAHKPGLNEIISQSLGNNYEHASYYNHSCNSCKPWRLLQSTRPESTFKCPHCSKENEMGKYRAICWIAHQATDLGWLNFHLLHYIPTLCFLIPSYEKTRDLSDQCWSKLNNLFLTPLWEFCWWCGVYHHVGLGDCFYCCYLEGFLWVFFVLNFFSPPIKMAKISLSKGKEKEARMRETPFPLMICSTASWGKVGYDVRLPVL